MKLPPPRFYTAAGTILGWRNGAVVGASGIRYARAARFQPPTDEPASATPVQATAPGPVCPQVVDSLLGQALGPVMAGRTFDEDCLRLTVTAPAEAQPQEGLPVIVWVHGGSYVSGAGDLAFYDPAPLITEQRVVVVAVTYRLGLFGFLGRGDAPANLGLLDLLAALRWVQRNIAAFGGDAACVTLLGHSSGGDAAAHLLVAEGATGLFRRVILHSAPLGLAPNRARMTRAMAAAVASIPPGAPPEAVLAREAAAWRAARWSGLKAGMPFGTQYGAFPLPPEDAVAEAWRAAAPRVDVLIGSTAEELRFFAVIDPKFRWLARFPWLGPAVTRRLVAAGSRRIYVDPAAAFARRHAQAGGRAYLFSVTYRPRGSVFGAAHTIDLPLLFGTRETWSAVPLLGNASWAEVQQAGQQVRRLWATFARTGTLPTPVEVPHVLHVTQVWEESLD
ncbi:carboxylesterase family protein [Hymenobacter busanensis]|uniref:Carboxylic ester hydrolase n=1 Tax=Hymenobacter busanensis TaxID=2607656 RepID=A0A7L4ZST0_9BACT|nr:carboxylesterase family protein [Hymenobacter busanensis]KAA9327697.1 carboxylesterase family protein [Hymenobacter busanensis]QHJ05963.1 carboxylesterase family protein [Hymenobacter busanensis]